MRRLIIKVKNISHFVFLTILILAFYAQAVSPGNCETFATITGLVIDQSGGGVPYVNVSLWMDGELVQFYKNETKNPQLSNDGRSADVGRFIFGYVQPGEYTLKVEKNGHQASQKINLSWGDFYAKNIIMEDYYDTPAISMSTIAPTIVPTPTTNNDSFYNGLIIGIGGVLGILIVLGIGILIGFALFKKK